MHPPFHVVDHKIGPDIHHSGDTKPVVRRGAPARLRLRAAVNGWPPIPVPTPALDGQHPLPSGRLPHPAPVLQIAPPARTGLRDFIGRWMIRTGQRMIMQGRA